MIFICHIYVLFYNKNQ
uniref:Uncharacterized protein n=1 Tax=Arundo donax TaxID=35708 RepID=A0A0A9GXG1_ARUDO